MNFSDPSKPRIKRGKGPKKALREHNYRPRAWPHLREDFEDRCAFTMYHLECCSHRSEMEVDHFNPQLKAGRRNAYSNLVLTLGACNNRKRKTWPTADEQRRGIRLLDPTAESDYGVLLFEDPTTHEIVGTTPAARYHILKLGLNEPDFVRARSERTELEAVTRNAPNSAPPQMAWPEMARAVKLLNQLVDRSIPRIPPPPSM